MVLRMALLAVPGWFTLAVLIFPVPASIKLAVAAVLFLSLISPAGGLLAIAAAAPLGQFLAQFAGLEHFRVSEALVLAFLTGWLLQGQDDRRGPSVPSTIGWLLACSIVGSIGGLAWHTSQYRGELGRTLDVVVHAYYDSISVSDRLGLVDGARLLEGLALMAATVALFRQRPRLADRLPAALAVSATAAGVSSVLLWLGVAPAAVLERYARIGYRVSAHVADLNAAGSYFAMVLCLAAGMAVRARRRERGLWLVAVVATAIGLWFAHSRTATAAFSITAVATVGWIGTLTWPTRVRVAALVSLAVVALAVGSFRARGLERDPTYRGAGFRTQFNESSLRMMAARPLFGVGVGQYPRTSPLFLTPELAWTYGTENAHNYFLQVGAELGILGFAFFAAWAGIGLWRAMRALGHQPRDARLLGCTAGIVALLGTCLTGHPLLVGEVAFPFWIQFGLVAGLAGSTLLNVEPGGFERSRLTPRPWRLAAAAMAVFLVVSEPVSAAWRPITPSASPAVDGFYGWETDQGGRRFRWTGRYASLFVPDDVRRANIQVRVPSGARGVAPIGVEVMVSGINRGRTVVGDSWVTISVAVPSVDPLNRYKRIDLRVDRTWQLALFVAGETDLRAVGVQVGECEFVR
jgi:O-antigen ligase